ncbi:unnamed protein product [Anisakis simplex]|uniref:Phospholipase B-like n=1 Tax=Anisakis simplex TaxID=6269 RepID=A0A0M3JMT2_ANISI|nr:unnamed protein product [Anisakis simplex]
MISYHIHNVIEDYCKNYSQYCERLNAFVKENMNWIKNELANKTSDDIYWAQVNRTLYQITGIYHGYDGKTPLNATISYDMHPIL